MAEIASKDIGLYYNTGTVQSPSWKLVACSTSDGFSGSTDNVSISNKCESGFTKNLPGDKSWSFSNSSYAQKSPSANQISYEDAFEMWVSDEVGQWKLESINSNEYLRIGEGWISDLGETADAGDFLQFNITIQGNGKVSNSLSS